MVETTAWNYDATVLAIYAGWTFQPVNPWEYQLNNGYSKDDNNNIEVNSRYSGNDGTYCSLYADGTTVSALSKILTGNGTVTVKR